MRILHGDCLALLPTLADNSIDGIVTDPPYHLAADHGRHSRAPEGMYQTMRSGFMGKAWDDDVAFHTDVWRECLRVLKPGGHIAVFGGSRTHHRVWVAVEDAGFEIRDTLMWLYAQGFPKSLDVSKAIDKHLGAEREVVGYTKAGATAMGQSSGWNPHANTTAPPITAPATPEAQQFAGWGTALKPSHEPILLARKPLIGTVAQNVLEHGVGGINVDSCRVPTGDYVEDDGRRIDTALSCHEGYQRPNASMFNTGKRVRRAAPANAAGRWPSNLLHDGSEEVVECFPQTKSTKHSASRYVSGASISKMAGEQKFRVSDFNDANTYNDEGSAARFFPALGFSDDDRRVKYCPKASKLDRAGSSHPTVKPIKLMEWLCRLICPPGGTILDPFAGSGTTGQAAANCGFDVIMIEREAEYVADIERRMAAITLAVRYQELSPITFS